MWFRPTDQTDLEPIELCNVVSTIAGLNFIGFQLVLRIRFGRFGWSKGSQSTTDGITETGVYLDSDVLCKFVWELLHIKKWKVVSLFLPVK